MSQDNVKDIFGGNRTTLSEQQVKEFEDSLGLLIKHVQLLAQIQKAKFDALVKEGFTKEEALELCKQVF